MIKINSGIIYTFFLLFAISGSATASYFTTGPSAEDFSVFTLPTAWDPGADTARVGGFPAAGGATWSIMGAGVGTSVKDPHGSNTTTAITGLISGSTVASMASIFNDALNVWADVSDFSNLGQVADSGGAFGFEGQQGDIRIGAIFIDGGSGPNVLAHAYQPGNSDIFGAGWDLAGDVHIDDSNTWGDGTGGTIDLFTVVLHEFGHSLGLGHSDIVGSVMEGTYAGPRTTLSGDDEAGIRSIYGPTVVPVPAAVWLFGSGLIALVGFARRGTKA